MFLQLKKKQNKVSFISEDILKNIEDGEPVEFQKVEQKFNEEFSKVVLV